MLPKVDALRNVVCVAGIQLGKKPVVPTASECIHTLVCYLCNSESVRTWRALIFLIAMPVYGVLRWGTGSLRRSKEYGPRSLSAPRLPHFVGGKALHHAETVLVCLR